MYSRGILCQVLAFLWHISWHSIWHIFWLISPVFYLHGIYILAFYLECIPMYSDNLSHIPDTHSTWQTSGIGSGIQYTFCPSFWQSVWHLFWRSFWNSIWSIGPTVPTNVEWSRGALEGAKSTFKRHWFLQSLWIHIPSEVR